MRILANENVPRDAVDLLVLRGHDVRWIRDSDPGIGDDVVLSTALNDQRLLITFDKDYGELVYRLRMPAPFGIVFFRISMPSSIVLARVVADVLDHRADWQGMFSVVDEQRIRMKTMPRF